MLAVPVAVLILACAPRSGLDTAVGTDGRRDGGAANVGDWDSAGTGTDEGSGDSGSAGAAGCGEGTAAVIDAVLYRTLEEAVAAAADGATVLVCPGEHRLAGEVGSRSLTLAGSTGIAADAVLSPVADDPVLSVRDGGSLTLLDLTVAHARSSTGPALWVADAGLAMARCTLSDNSGEGGAIRMQASADHAVSLVADSCFWQANRTTGLGSAIGVAGPGTADVSISGSSLVGNEADQGGAIFMGSGSGSLFIESTELLDNHARTLGGAVYVNVDDGVVHIDKSRMVGNRAQDGGGLYLSAQGARAQLRIRASVFEDNRADELGGAMYLGAVNSELELANVWIGENRGHDGAGIAVEGAGGGVQLSLQDSTLTLNSAAGSGGAIDVRTGEGAGGLTGDIRVQGCQIDGNQAGDAAVDVGPGVGLQASTTTWGQGETDNVPADLRTAAGSLVDLDAKDTVVCDAAGACTR